MTEPLAGSLACAKFQACRKPCNLAIELGIAKDRIETIIDFAAAGKHHVKTDGSAAAADRQTVAYLANLIAWGEIVMPIAAIYPFDAIRDAYVKLGKRKTHGKIVLDVSGKIVQRLHPSN